MNNTKLGVILLALLLTAMVIVPIVSAAGASESSDASAISLDNQTTTLNGLTLPAVQWISHPYDASKSHITPMTREEFISANQEHINSLTKTVGKEAAEKTVNDEYTKIITGRKSASASVPSTIMQLGNRDIFLWPYEVKDRQNMNYNDPEPITFVVLGNTRSEFHDFLTSHGWSHCTLAWPEYGLSGSSLVTLNWDWGQTNVEKASGSNHRYHCTIHDGGYSSILGDDWSYGECHYEIWTGTDHNIESGGFNTGETALYNTVGSHYNKYSSNLGNSMGSWFNGNGHMFKAK